MAFSAIFRHAGFSASSLTTGINSRALMSTKFVNKVELLGRVGREPQKVGTSDAVAFPFYTESVLKLKDGSMKTYPCWHRVIAVRRGIADIVLNSLERGQRCYISGRIAYRAPEQNADGKFINSHQAAVVVENIVFLEKSRKAALESEEQKESMENM